MGVLKRCMPEEIATTSSSGSGGTARLVGSVSSDVHDGDSGGTGDTPLLRDGTILDLREQSFLGGTFLLDR